MELNKEPAQRINGGLGMRRPLPQTQAGTGRRSRPRSYASAARRCWRASFDDFCIAALATTALPVVLYEQSMTATAWCGSCHLLSAACMVSPHGLVNMLNFYLVVALSHVGLKLNIYAPPDPPHPSCSSKRRVGDVEACGKRRRRTL